VYFSNFWKVEDRFVLKNIQDEVAVKSFLVYLQINSYNLYDLFLCLSQIHFGVNSVSNNFAVERRAVNEATFRCPDELGWQPQVCLSLKNS